VGAATRKPSTFHLGCAPVWGRQRDFSQDSSTCRSYQADRYVFQPSTDWIFSSKHKTCLLKKNCKFQWQTFIIKIIAAEYIQGQYSVMNTDYKEEFNKSGDILCIIKLCQKVWSWSDYQGVPGRWTRTLFSSSYAAQSSDYVLFLCQYMSASHISGIRMSGKQKPLVTVIRYISV